MPMPAFILVNDLARLRDHWGWLVALGVGLVVLGAIALSFAPAATTLGTVLVLGWLITLEMRRMS